MKKGTAAKQISQETFDEVVKENIEDFDMSQEDATLDAITQFETQGVDLSNIIKMVGNAATATMEGASEGASSTGGVPTRFSAEEQLQKLKDLVAALKATQPSPQTTELLQTLDGLHKLLEQIPEMKVLAGRNDAIDPLVELINSETPHAVVDKASSLLAYLCVDNCDNQDFVGAAGLQKFAIAIATQCASPSSSSSSPSCSTTTGRLLTAVRAICSKNETNKAHFAKAKGVDAVCLHLPLALEDDALSKQIAGVLRVMTMNDDLKATFSQAQDTIKVLVSQDIIAYALNVLRSHFQDQKALELVSCWLAIVKQIAITEENCKKIYDLGGLDLVFQLMQSDPKNPALVKRCVTVFRNVAAADDIKEYIISSGGAAQILDAMRQHHGDASLQQHACATLAAIALRSPENSTQLVDLGAARQMALAMRTHRGDTSLLRQASLAIRNMVARAPELRVRILDEDVEELLRDAQQYRGCGDEAYAALRDLGCDIQLSSFGLAGTATGGGAGGFNPVNIESYDLLDTIDEAAEAPFAIPY